MHRINLNGQTLYAEDGETLSSVLIRNGLKVEHPCGGRGSCRKCTVWVDGQAELSCQYTVRHDITLTLAEEENILSETGAAETGDASGKLCFALDIGTTTLALALVAAEEGRIVRVMTRTNPQRTFGADVMSRIDHCRKHGPTELAAAVISEVNSMIADFALPQVETLYAAGNATMLHLFFGVDCSAMGAAPYTPVFLEEKRAPAAELGLRGVQEVVALPSIAAFVGADLVAGLHCAGLPEPGKHNLLIDLGTNAEVVLYSAQDALCTAAAAGPCFEGANISCGMSAISGAIYAYSPDAGARTIGDAPARGICGTGLVDVIAALLADETIDETGFMEDGEFSLAPGVALQQQDVRQYQLAKSAVYSAIMTLMKLKNVTPRDIQTMYISGGFSAKINIVNAVATGLLPGELAGRCVALNNSSLLGTAKYACSPCDLSVYTQNARYVDLSANPVFSDLFVENMLFETE